MARVTCHSIFKKLARLMFQAHFFKFMAASNGSIPVHFKVRYFRWFSIIRHLADCRIPASKCTISTFSAEINNRKSCRQIRFSSPKYTKMRLRPGPGPQWGSLQRSHRPLAAGGEGARCPPPKKNKKQTPPALSPARGPRVFGPWPQKSCASLG